MSLEWLDNYLLVVNIVGFVLYVVNTLLYRNTYDKNVDPFLTICSIAGGSLGIVIAIFIFDRKAGKENMMSRVFVFSILVIQIIIVLWITGHHSENINLEFIRFFKENKVIVFYLLIINIITFAAFAIDKFNAINRRSRIAIVTLLILAFIGGSIGGLIAMYAFKHKIRKDYFTVGIPLIILMQIFIVFYFMNRI